MTIIPIVVLAIGLVVFRRNYILTDEKLEEITKELEAKRVE
jgi:melibiose permease